MNIRPAVTGRQEKPSYYVVGMVTEDGLLDHVDGIYANVHFAKAHWDRQFDWHWHEDQRWLLPDDDTGWPKPVILELKLIDAM